MSFQDLIEVDAIKNLKKYPLYDITDLEEKERWQFFFTKMNIDKKYTCTWVDERLLFYEHGVLDLVLRAYKAGISFDYQDGKTEMLFGGGYSEKAQNDLKEKLNWEKGSTVVLIPIDDEKGEFKLIKTSELNIVLQKPFTKEEEMEIITPFIERVRSQIKELRIIFDNEDFSVKNELENWQNELTELIKWTKEKTSD